MKSINIIAVFIFLFAGFLQLHNLKQVVNKLP